MTFTVGDSTSALSFNITSAKAYRTINVKATSTPVPVNIVKVTSTYDKTLPETGKADSGYARSYLGKAFLLAGAGFITYKTRKSKVLGKLKEKSL